MIAIIVINNIGKKIAEKIKKDINEDCDIFYPSKGKLKYTVKRIFNNKDYNNIIFIMALGIVVRAISPHLKNKCTDPAVVTVDSSSHYAISTASGHEGGANKLSYKVANIINAEPVVTTQTESIKKKIIGVGCRKNIKKEEIIEAIKQTLKKNKLSLNNIKLIATIDIKKNETDLIEACDTLEIPLKIISSNAVKTFKGDYTRSSFVKNKVGVEGVCEPCALLAGKNTKLIVQKNKINKVTIAIAEEA